MRKKIWLAIAICAAAARLGQAQGPDSEPRDLRRDHSPAAVSPTPEMWFYEQERTRHEDPKAAVRRRAEYRSAQRAGRMESLKWYGMSNSRPVAAADPFSGGGYSPSWVSNSANPYQWRTSATPFVVVRPGVMTY